MLTILLATCEVTLDRARAGEYTLDDELAANLARLIQRARAELDALMEGPEKRA